ncbi:ImmA/IrrE family metallo-endopeptidase [Bacillus velezensis]|uniref:ImmA/IrrE family metallo-endopeptidase n=1 Tax=Bacillus velezensis TaxID=492670 RepID=UPI0035A5BD37
MINEISRERKLAQRLIKKFDLTPPINIRELIEKYAKCVEDCLPNNADAICIMNIKEPLVVLDKAKSETRKRFTLAHELGHLIIPWHSGMISCHTENENSIDQTAYQIMENEANNFAAEILMPSSWLNEMVLEYEEQGVNDLIKIIAEKAHVSRIAAFFSIINFLPSGYVLHINNNELNFNSFKKSTGTSIIIPTRNYEHDYNWLEKNSINKGTCEIDNIFISWWKFQKCLPVEQLAVIIEESKLNLTIINKMINDTRDRAFVSSFTELIKLLPTGYIIDIRGRDYNRFFKSPNTNIGIPNFKNIDDEISWFEDNSNISGYFKTYGYYYFWGHFVVKTPHIKTTNDKRLSKDILKAILTDCYSNEEEKRKITFKLNGIVGALNNKAPNEFDEFYRLFQERLIGEQIYREIMQHKDFEVFIVNKINELLAKKDKG